MKNIDFIESYNDSGTTVCTNPWNHIFFENFPKIIETSYRHVMYTDKIAKASTFKRKKPNQKISITLRVMVIWNLPLGWNTCTFLYFTPCTTVFLFMDWFLWKLYTLKNDIFPFKHRLNFENRTIFALSREKWRVFSEQAVFILISF